MRTVHFAAALVAAASVFALAGCMPIGVPPGPMMSEDREIDEVTTVVLDTSGDLSISEGEPGLVIHASEGALDRLTSEVDGDTLVLGTTPGPGFVFGEVRYELSLPDLETIELNGSGDVDATISAEGTVGLVLDGSGHVNWTALDTNRVEIRISGSGGAELAGATTELSIQVDGSGNVDAEDLQAREADISISGSGNVDLSVSESLSAEVSGSGHVTYSGDPAVVNTDVSGSGDVVRD